MSRDPTLNLRGVDIAIVRNIALMVREEGTGNLPLAINQQIEQGRICYIDKSPALIVPFWFDPRGTKGRSEGEIVCFGEKTEEDLPRAAYTFLARERGNHPVYNISQYIYPEGITSQRAFKRLMATAAYFNDINPEFRGEGDKRRLIGTFPYPAFV